MIKIKKNFFFLLVALPVILVIVSILFIPLRYIFIKIVQIPVKIIHNLLRHISSVLTLRAISFDVQKFDNLKGSYAKLSTDFKELSAENQRLRRLLEFKKSSKLRYIVAEVVFADASNWSWGIIINKGKNAGLQKDDPVITPEGLVGKITSVWGDTSHVLLLNDPDFAASAMLSATRDNVAVVGSLDGSCRALYVSENADIKRGDDVITSGLESIFPKGIPVGRVKAIEQDYTGSPYLIIKPYVNINRVEEVLVIKK